MNRVGQVKALYRQHFPAFLRFACRELHPGRPLVDAWHVDVIADHLGRVARGEITRLVINLPPQPLTSMAASVALPAWLLGRDPRRTILSIAGTRDFARDLEQSTRALMSAPRCRALFPHLDASGRFGDLRLPHGGCRLAGVVGGQLSSRGADLIVVDHPNVAAHTYDAGRRRAVNAWFDDVVQRLDDKAEGAVIVLMSRLHNDDLSGHLLRGQSPWVHLNLPAIATEDETWPLPGSGIYRRARGEALASTIDSKPQLLQRLAEMGAYRFAAQYQQTPFEHLNADELRGGCFTGPDDGSGFPTRWFGRVPERSILAHDVFGIGTRHPATPPRRLTEAELERKYRPR